MRKTVTFGTLATVLLAPAVAWAHPRGPSTSLIDGFMHPIMGIDHVLAMVAVGVWAAQMGARAVWAVPAAFCTAMIAGGMLGLIGIEGPAVEPLVAATVLALGILIMSGFRASVVEGALLAAAFAVFHGAAHMAEATATANLVFYGAGFLAATVLLHLIGISAAFAVRCRDNLLRVAAAPVALAGVWMLLGRIT